MNPLQMHAISQSRKLSAAARTPNSTHRNISTDALVALVQASNGSTDSTGGTPVGTLSTPLPRSASRKYDVAICVGGGGDPLAEFEAAKAMCDAAGATYEIFVCNDALAVVPGRIDYGCTLHPDKWTHWKGLRDRAGHPMPLKLAAHRSYPGFDHWTKDWQGSSGLFMVKIAREKGHTHIILCGIPMTVEGDHFARHQRWNAATGFRKGWARVQGALRPFVRSLSGWTMTHFGAPDEAWIKSDIPDPFPMSGPEHKGESA